MRTLPVLSVLILLAACTERPASDDHRPAAPAPVGFREPTELTVVSGVVPVAVGDRSLTLWADGKPLPSNTRWDSRGVGDGLVQLSLRRGSTVVDRVRVVLLNRGAEVFFTNGSSGKVVVPSTGYQRQHLRHHFQMTEGARRVMAILTWDQPGFDLEFALGRGTCPHHGESMGDRHDTISPVVLTHEAAPEQTLPTGQWFAHVRLMNEQAVSGKQTGYAVRAYTMR